MEKLLNELVEYTGRDINLVRARCTLAATEIAWQFANYRDNPLALYRESDLYIFTLTNYQIRMKKAREWFRNLIGIHGWKTMLDYGGGIGEHSIIACKEGVRVDYLDVEDSKTWEYAKWRFNKHEVNPDMLKEGTPIENDYDVIVIMDVLEHLENPKEVIEQMAKHTKYIICNPTEIKYNWLYPEHISRYDLEPYFKHVEAFLFERKGNG